MSETKFTPGPWVRGAAAQVYTAPKLIEKMPFPWEFFPICNANPCCHSEEENAANAALIAAAPEMYEQLKRHCAMCMMMHPDCEGCGICDTGKVLKKARGEK